MKPTLHFQRFEFKYPMHKPTAEKIIPALLKYMSWDPFVSGRGDKSYLVNSLYFDNSGYGCYFEKESGEKFRKKFRLRVYESEVKDDTNIFVEIKRKNNALIIKDRVHLPAKDARRILVNNKLNSYVGQISDDDMMVLKEFLWTKNYNCMMPRIMVAYRRKPLVAKTDRNVRVTFDYDIRAKLTNWFNCNNFAWKEVLPGSLILEIKYNNILPFWLHEIIQKYQLERVAFSKYCNAVRACMPQIDDGSGRDSGNYLGV
ncbi:polyphosphate polymerase domain-containing protein [Patescibacteria group bacterium]|nr:polyphosphate polymerase domain-containing protein [Patescibacteria group bacterium]MBU4511794.1 polyphosphate polymerase domain-containing protein [Patescibacteria group bacterium]